MKLFGMNKKLFLEMAFIKAFEIEIVLDIKVQLT